MTSQSPFPTHARVVAYLRDSGGDEQDLSIAQQEERVTSWCTENQLILTAVYADEARPGSSVIGRNNFLAMIRHFEDPACLDNGVIFWKYSRFSRDVDDAQYYRSLLRVRGYIVHSIQDDIPDNDFGRLYETVIDFSNSKFLKDLSDDVKRGLQHMLTTYGAVPGTPPRGFIREPVEIGKRRDGSSHIVHRWVIDPALSETVKQAWLMRAEGISIKEIHKTLLLYGSRNSYTTFFTNRLYLGELQYGDLVIPDYAPALVTRQTWDAVQAINGQNAQRSIPALVRHPRRENSPYLLSGLIHCAACGSIMNGKTITGRDRKPVHYYECARAKRNMDCPAKRIPQPDIETLVLNSLREIILDPALLAERSLQLAQQSQSGLSAIQEEKTRLIQRINDNKKRINNLVDKIAEDPNAPRSIIARLKDIELEIAAMQARLDTIKASKMENIYVAIDTDRARDLSRYIVDLIQSEDLELKRSILRALIKEIFCERQNRHIRAVITYWNPEGT